MLPFGPGSAFSADLIRGVHAYDPGVCGHERVLERSADDSITRSENVPALPLVGIAAFHNVRENRYLPALETADSIVATATRRCRSPTVTTSRHLVFDRNSDGLCRDRQQCGVLRGRFRPLERLLAAAVASSARIRAAPVAALLAGIALAACDSGLPAQGQEPHDFYVLAISWVPQLLRRRGRFRPNTRSMRGAGRATAMSSTGFGLNTRKAGPKFCENRGDEAWVADDLVIRDAGHHAFARPGRRISGASTASCSGLSQEDYFALTRAAFDRITLPSPSSATVAPDDLERSVIELNDGLQPGAMAVTCDREFLRENRICMEADLEFRPCPEGGVGSSRRGSGEAGGAVGGGGPGPGGWSGAGPGGPWPSRACTLDTARMPPVPR